MQKEEILQKLEQSFSEDIDDEEILSIADKIIQAGIDPKEAIDVASKRIKKIGDLFEEGELFLPDLMIAGKKMEHLIKALKAHLKSEGGTKIRGRVIVGTVKGDIHDIGKNLLVTQLSISGLEIFDLGVDVVAIDFIKAAKTHKANIIAVSALLTNTIPYQEDIIKLLIEMGLRQDYFIVVGGGPVTKEIAIKMHADGWADSAISARKVCEQLLAGNNKPPLKETFVLTD